MLDSTTLSPQIIEGGGGQYTILLSYYSSYNKEPFIRKCLESCINQTFQDVKIIVVDDCSQDITPAILHEYQAHKNLTIIQNSSNSGAFASRIIGEEYAKGEYIIHIDGDDFVKETMCEVLYPLCKTNQWDIIGFGWINIGLDGKHTTMLHTIGECSVYDAIMQLGITTQAFKSSVIHKTHKFIKSIFSEKLPNLNNLEDGAQAFAIAIFAKKYLGISETLYYCQNNLQSTTGDCSNISKNLKKLKDIKHSIAIMIDMTNHFQLNQKNKEDLIFQIKKAFTPIVSSYEYIYHHSKAYENKPFAYPINFLKSLWYVQSPKVFGKTIVRIFIYLATLGKVRI